MDLYKLDKNETFLISQKVLIIENGKLLILKNVEGKFNSVSQWELPGGIVEIDEDLKQSLIREVKEETGLDISIDRFFDSFSHWLDNFKFNDGRVLNIRFIELAYFCKKISGKLELSEEHDNYMWATKKQLEELDFAINSKFAIKKYL
jgi:8-oxo-dGTP diphosphatase